MVLGSSLSVLGSFYRAVRNSLVHFSVGDLTESTADVLVSSDDWDLTMRGGVSAAIHRAGGDVVALDAAKFIPAKLGDVVVTSAGSLPAKYIFHAITTSPPGMPTAEEERIDDEELVALLTRRCLALVESLNCSSIAFPALGTGTAGLDGTIVARVMLAVVKEVLVDRERPIRVSFWSPKGSPVSAEALAEEFSRDDARVSEADSQASIGEDTRNRVFICYSHEDKRRLNELVTKMKPLVTDRNLDLWVDTQIPTGAKWRDEIDEALLHTRVAVLLVSPAFLASEFISTVELPRLLKAAQHDGVRVVVIHESASLWEETPLAPFQAANNPKRPLDSLRKPQRNDTLVNICRTVKKHYEV